MNYRLKNLVHSTDLIIKNRMERTLCECELNGGRKFLVNKLPSWMYLCNCCIFELKNSILTSYKKSRKVVVSWTSVYTFEQAGWPPNWAYKVS